MQYKNCMNNDHEMGSGGADGLISMQSKVCKEKEFLIAMIPSAVWIVIGIYLLLRKTNY